MHIGIGKVAHTYMDGIHSKINFTGLSMLMPCFSTLQRTTVHQYFVRSSIDIVRLNVFNRLPVKLYRSENLNTEMKVAGTTQNKYNSLIFHSVVKLLIQKRKKNEFMLRCWNYHMVYLDIPWYKEMSPQKHLGQLYDWHLNSCSEQWYSVFGTMACVIIVWDR